MAPEPDLVRDFLAPGAYGRCAGAAGVVADDARLVGVPDRRRRLEGQAPGRFRLPRFPHAGGAPARLRGRGAAQPAPRARRLPGRRAGARVAGRLRRCRAPGRSSTGPCTCAGCPTRRAPRRCWAAACCGPSAWRRWRNGWRPSWMTRARRPSFGAPQRPAPQRRRELRPGGSPSSAISSTVPTFDDVRAFQLGALAAHADRFVARVDEGRIRDGHGDLRLEHVYFLPEPDGIVAIDCIEFNDRFRCGDAAGEAAFLAMELEAARRPDLGRRLPGALRGRERRLRALRRLDFYLSYRAWVRGKVAAFLASDASGGGGAARAQARRGAPPVRARAIVLRRPVDAPFVVAVGGHRRQRQEHAGDGAGTGAGRAGGQHGSDAQGGGRVGGDGAGRRAACTRPKRSIETMWRS